MYFLISCQFAPDVSPLCSGCVLIENMGEDIDAMLQPVLSRSVIRRGAARLIRVGTRDVEFHRHFRLLLHTKLSNPHYPPEVSAQTTIVNFVITREGLTEQLLGLVVAAERPDLGKEHNRLVAEQHSHVVKLREVEDQLLTTLSNFEGDILADVDLIQGLEQTKEAGKQLEARKNEAAATGRAVKLARGAYRSVAERAGLLWTLIDSMWRLSHTYRFSVSHFLAAFEDGIKRVDATKASIEAESKKLRVERVPCDDGLVLSPGAVPSQADPTLSERVQDLQESTTLSCFLSASDGLHERHKLVLAAELCLSSLLEQGKLDRALYNALLNGSRPVAPQNPLREWLSDDGWGAVLHLEDVEVGQVDLLGETVGFPGSPTPDGAAASSNPFDGLASDMVEAAKKFRWVYLPHQSSV